MEVITIVVYSLVFVLWLYGLRESIDRGFGYVIASAIFWPVGFALGVTRLFTKGKRNEDTAR